MHEDNRGADRETIWGINRRDRRWFQLMTLLGGTGGSVTLIWLTLSYRAAVDTPDELAFSIPLGIGASFVGAGFVAWSLLQVKEMAMPIGDWIREANERRRQRLRDEGREEGKQQGREEGREEGILIGFERGRAEGYGEGYIDGKEGNPPQPPTGGSETAG